MLANEVRQESRTQILAGQALVRILEFILGRVFKRLSDLCEKEKTEKM